MEKNVRIRLLLVMELLIGRTDDKHGVSMQDILTWLEECGIAGERKSIYEDIHALQRYGVDIEYNSDDKTYRVKKRNINMEEAEIVISALRKYKDIEENTADHIIKRILGYLSFYEREELSQKYI